MRKNEVKAGIGCLTMFLSSIALVKFFKWTFQSGNNVGGIIIVIMAITLPLAIFILLDNIKHKRKQEYPCPHWRDEKCNKHFDEEEERLTRLREAYICEEKNKTDELPF